MGGLSGIFLGIIVMCAAGVFSVPPAFFPGFEAWLFHSKIYIDLCIGWASLGACMCVCGCIYQCCGCAPDLSPKAREIEDLDVEGLLSSEADAPPAPYIMIT